MHSLTITPSNALARVADWGLLLTTWLNTLNSENTRRGYRREVTLAMEDLGGLTGLTPLVLIEYRSKWLARLDGTKPLSPASVAHHLAALRSFLVFVRRYASSSISEESIDKALKSPKATVIRPYQVLTIAEGRRLIGSARACPRDRVMIDFALATGLRSAEVCNVRVSDLSEDEQGDLMLRVRQGKGRKDRIVPLSQAIGSVVRSYLKYRHLTLSGKREEYLFASRKGRGHGRLSTARLRQLMQQYTVEAEITKPISMHSLRHTAGITWLREGAPIVAIQKLLGHASLSTTQKYVDHLGLDELKAVVNHESVRTRSVFPA